MFDFADLGIDPFTKYLDGPYAGLNASARIDRHYASLSDLPDHQLPHIPEDRSLGGLATDADRMRALEMLKQDNNPDDPTASDRCGAAALIGGALLADGPNGVRGLLDQVDAYGKKRGVAAAADGTDPLAAVREKLAAGKELTVGDMETLQAGVYDALHAVDARRTGDDSGGLSPGTLADFMGASPGLQKMFKDHDLGLDVIDTRADGFGAGNHVVLGIGGGRGGDRQDRRTAIYDPMSRIEKERDPGTGAETIHDGSQVVRAGDELADYQAATRQEIDATGLHRRNASYW